MKKVNIRLYIKSFKQFEDFFHRILIVFSGKEIAHLEMNLVMDTLDDHEIKCILKFIRGYHAFKEISNDTIYTFIATVSPSHKIPGFFSKAKGMFTRIDLAGIDDFSKIVDTVNSFQQKKLPVSLVIKENDMENIIRRCKEFSVFGIPVFSGYESCYDSEFVSLFWEWFYDKNGCRINLFADVLSKILLDYWGTVCRYKSCLTKYFVIKEDGTIYGCREQNNEICNLHGVASMNELISQENFTILLKNSIAKRSLCKQNCHFYGICQGGCPMEASVAIENCKNKQLFDAMEEITENVKKIIPTSDFRDWNPAVREMILSSVASNKLFEKGLFI